MSKVNLSSSHAKTKLLPKLTLEEYLKKNVIGTIDGLPSIVDTLIIHQAGLSDPTKPVGSFFISGPTGTGKTYLVETVSEYLHGVVKLLKIDCGTYASDHEVARLLGSPPGYLGHRESPPMLAQNNVNAAASDKSPISVVLFDEADKAGNGLHKTLLSLLDKATIQLGDNTTTSFQNSLVFFTSNYGQSELFSLNKHGGKPALGFGEGHEVTTAKHKEIVMKTIGKAMSPEFINRLDHWITFSPHTEADTKAILTLELTKIINFVKGRLGSRAPDMCISDEMYKYLLTNGYSKEYGARPLKRLLRASVLLPLAKALGDNNLTGTMYYHVEDGKPIHEFQEAAQAA